MEIKFKFRWWVGWLNGQLSTPYLTIYWDRNPRKDAENHWAVSLNLGVIVGEAQVWIGNNLQDLV